VLGSSRLASSMPLTPCEPFDHNGPLHRCPGAPAPCSILEVRGYGALDQRPRGIAAIERTTAWRPRRRGARRHSLDEIMRTIRATARMADTEPGRREVHRHLILRKDIVVTRTRRLALAAGVFYLLTFAFSIPAYFLYEPVLTDPAYIIGSGGADTRIILGAVLEMLTALAGIGTAVAVYPVVRRQSEAASLGFVTTRMYEAAVMIIGVIALVSIVSLRQAGPAAGTDGTAMVAIGQALIDIRDQTARFGPGFVPALNALCFGYVLYRSRLVPRIIPALGLIGAPLLLASVIGEIFGLHDQSVFAAVALVPIFFWELSVGLWMTFKGFNPSALTALGFDAKEGGGGRIAEAT
jgi:Domain of unknown function (DUF4386)